MISSVVAPAVGGVAVGNGWCVGFGCDEGVADNVGLVVAAVPGAVVPQAVANTDQASKDPMKSAFHEHVIPKI